MNRARARSARPRWLLLALLAGLLAGLLPLLGSLLGGGSLLWGAAALAGLAGLYVLVVGWPFSGVALLILAALFTRYRFDAGPVSVRPEHIAALAVAAVGVVQVLAQRGRLRFPLPFWFALAWWGMNLISGLFFSPVMATGVQNALRIALLVLTLFLIINLIPDRRHWWWALALFLAAGVAEAAFGIAARALFPFGINLGVQVAWNFTEPIPYGTFEEGNLFGSHTASWALVLLMLIFAAGNLRRPSPRQLWMAGGLLILLGGLFLSLSRAAWLMFAAGAAVVWIVYRRSSWHQANRLALLLSAGPFFVFLILALAPYLPASWPFVDRLQSFLSLSSDPTFSARLQDWGLAWHEWLRRPWSGWGPGSFVDIYGILRAHPAWISNLTLRLLQETGLIGALAFAGYLVTLVLPALKVGTRQPRPLDRAALLGLTISYLALVGLAYQSTDGIWLAASWVHAGLIASGVRVFSQKEPPAVAASSAAPAESHPIRMGAAPSQN